MIDKRYGDFALKKMIIGTLILIALLFVNCFVYFSSAEETKDELVIVVDAGHGGNDPGKVSANGIMEKDVNLAIAIKLKNELEAKGAKVILIRDSDTNLAMEGATNKKISDLNQRMAIVNDENADLLISIHQNSYTDKNVKGAQVFYGASEESELLAKEIQGCIREYVDTDNNRKAKSGKDYYILRKSACPSVIIECGFLSNPNETAKLIDERYQQKLAEGIAKAVENVYMK
ncbi:MAG: N-acetylmuramoyl-L-alanine amidase CwlD [Lachnospiraceae bacterium]|nr:N-acetylmuramoyl-L-alanine amidase CwlD [Lachnospiraceae bacterium]